jgi:3-oxoisoapionate decarboxylase
MLLEYNRRKLPVTRRNFLATTAIAPFAAAGATFTGNPPPCKMGIATTSYMTAAHPKDTYAFLDHCHALGAAGIQSPLNGDLAKVRARAQQLGMYIEAMAPLPKGPDTSAFEKALGDASAAGALCVRSACLSGRRYETFASFADWQQFAAQSKESLKNAIPLAEKYKIPLALENHKDWTADEMLVLLKTHSSEYLGMCLDFGNNVSLLDDPMSLVENLAPYAISVHVKDVGVEDYPDGFLLSEVALGEGYLDLARMISLIRQARPNTKFTLEMITRNPLKVPCLTDKYWATFPDRNGSYLARTLKVVQKEGTRLQALPRIDMLTHEGQLRLEEENVKACLNHAREKLDL